MKVVHIALTDSGGAGIGMMNLHHALLAQGIDSKVLVAIKRCNEAEVVAMPPNLHVWGKRGWLQRLQRAACRMGVCFTPFDVWHRRVYKVRKQHPVSIYSMPITQYDVLHHPLVKAADIIHLHFVDDFVDFSTFFARVAKPVVWTIRDESPMLGGFHYATDKAKLSAYYGPIEQAFVNIKRKAIEQCKQLHLILLSHATQAFCPKAYFLASRPQQIIYNPICASDFRPIDKTTARSKWGLHPDDVVIAFVCTHLDEERKGFDIVIEAIKLLNNPHLKLLCAGQANAQLIQRLPNNVICLGAINDKQQLSALYSAANLYVNTSAQESFGKTIVEALFCGTPIVSTAVGIAPEVINKRNGVICPTHSPRAIAQGITQVLASTYDSNAIRQQVLQRFDVKVIAQQHKALYEALSSTK